jgi:hypothetical protein
MMSAIFQAYRVLDGRRYRAAELLRLSGGTADQARVAAVVEK